jgi:queuine tRNA-ribosyltransferase
MPPVAFEIQQRDSESHARVGRVTTPHGEFDTPAFMPVGTQATVKGLTPDQVAATGAQIVLANTYHLMLRPGAELIGEMGGLQSWMGWSGPMLTDSGGYQVFSLAEINRIDDDGVRFRSHIDGQYVDLTPERSIEVQNHLGADIIMAFDDCPPGEPADAGAYPESGTGESGGGDPAGSLPPSAPAKVQADRRTTGAEAKSRPSAGRPSQGSRLSHDKRLALANERTIRWLDRCIAAHDRTDRQALFGIVQGGTDLSKRQWCLDAVTARDLPGYAIGGVAVGEGPRQMKRVVDYTAPRLPVDRPRYLMGVGYARDIVMAVRAGVDMFDCVLPTRNGRNGVAFTREGPVRLKNARFRADRAPIEADCDCPVCAAGFSRSYLRHLFMAGEMLGGILTSAHNLRHFQRLVLDIRTAIAHNAWSSFFRAWPVAAPVEMPD